MALHNRLKQARLDKNLSQQELEKISKVHYTNIGRYERGKAKPSAEVLKRLAKALEVSPDYLLNGTIGNKASETFTDDRLLNYFKKIEQLPENTRTFRVLRWLCF